MQVSEELPWEQIQEQDIQSAVEKSFQGDIMQVPPMYSAIKVRLGCITLQNFALSTRGPSCISCIPSSAYYTHFHNIATLFSCIFENLERLIISLQVKGERLYTKARRGEEIVVPPRPVKIYDFQLKRSSKNRFLTIFINISFLVLYSGSHVPSLGIAKVHLTKLISLSEFGDPHLEFYEVFVLFCGAHCVSTSFLCPGKNGISTLCVLRELISAPYVPISRAH